MQTLEVLFTPADFGLLPGRNLAHTTCVVLDIFRATTSMVAALANGAEAVVPVGEISEALAVRRQQARVLLAGERDGLRIRAEQSGGVEFDLGNSPREFGRGRVAGRTIVMTTTNGTRALRACAHARRVLIGSLLNLNATAECVIREKPESLLIVCGGTFEQTALEDVLAAGAICDLVWNTISDGGISDAALLARRLFRAAAPDLPLAAMESRNARRLLARPELKDDVPFCLQRDVFELVAVMQTDGRVIREP